MYTLAYDFQNNIPVFRCNFCGNCHGTLESTSYVDIKNRGCCWYFPKYNLVDIKNILENSGRKFLGNLASFDFANISQYFIEMRGLFKEHEYELLMSETEDTNFQIEPKLFFKICPFCGFKGCTLDFDLRPHPCNLYLCRNVIDLCGEKYSSYSNERKDYFSYCNFYSEAIKSELIQNNTDLIKNFNESLNIIEAFTLPKFENRNLETITLSFNNNNNIPA